MIALNITVAKIHNKLFFKLFTWFTRTLLAIAFIPLFLSGKYRENQ